MKKLLCFALSLLVLTSCGESKSTSSSSASLSYTDDSGVTTTFTSHPENVAVLFSSYADIWSSVGGKITVTVGDSIKRGFANEGTTLVQDGAGLSINNEVLLAAKPDLVIATADFSAQLKTVELCRDSGINALALKEESFSDYLKILKLFADLNDNKAAYQKLGLDGEDQIEEIKAKPQPEKKPSYLFIRAGSAFNSTKIRKASNHFACLIFDELGGQNVADSLNGMSENLSLESIVEADPEKIFIVPQGDEEASRNYMDSLLSSEGYSSLSAVKNNKVTYLSKELFNFKPNSRWAEAYQVAYQALYD